MTLFNIRVYWIFRLGIFYRRRHDVCPDINDDDLDNDIGDPDFLPEP